MLIDKLIESIIAKKNPTVVGLDPQMEFIPDSILAPNLKHFGETLEAVAAAFFDFNVTIIDAVYEYVPAVKLQIAMYEQLGVFGLKCYRETIEYAKGRGLIVIGDVKRSDIASSASFYSAAHLGEVSVGKEKYRPFPSDFITVNPYLGEDALTPFFDDAKKYDKGVFVLVKTSNPGGGLFQDIAAGGMKLYERVGEFVEGAARDFTGKYGYSNIGAVVGATYPEQIMELRALMPHVFFLIPGYGAQGASAEDVARAFDGRGAGAIINSSRGIIAAHSVYKHKSTFTANGFEAAVSEAVFNMRDDLQKYICFGTEA